MRFAYMCGVKTSDKSVCVWIEFISLVLELRLVQTPLKTLIASTIKQTGSNCSIEGVSLSTS